MVNVAYWTIYEIWAMICFAEVHLIAGINARIMCYYLRKRQYKTKALSTDKTDTCYIDHDIKWLYLLQFDEDHAKDWGT